MKSFRQFALGLLAGCLLMLSLPVIASTVKQYVLVPTTYPIVVNGNLYAETDLPIMNYEGNTYIPLRATGELLGASVHWNEHLRRAEITYDPGHLNNTAFRNVKVTGSQGSYTISGEARIFEAIMHYSVSDGHRYIEEKPLQLDHGAPTWSPFEFQIELVADQIPANGTLTLELFEHSANDGTKINIYSVPLENFIP